MACQAESGVPPPSQLRPLHFTQHPKNAARGVKPRSSHLVRGAAQSLSPHPPPAQPSRGKAAQVRVGTGAAAASAAAPPPTPGEAQPFSSPTSLAAAPAAEAGPPAGEARAGPHPARLKLPAERLAASFSAAGQGAGWADAGGRGEQLGAAAAAGGSPAAGGESAAPAVLEEGSHSGPQPGRFGVPVWPGTGKKELLETCPDPHP